jgi:hypothetical protein
MKKASFGEFSFIRLSLLKSMNCQTQKLVAAVDNCAGKLKRLGLGKRDWIS